MKCGKRGNENGVSVYEHIGSLVDGVSSKFDDFVGRAFPDFILKLSKTGTIMEFRSVPDLGVDLNGKPIHALYDTELSGFFKQAITDVLKTMAPKSIQYALHIHQSEPYWFEALILPLDSQQAFALIKDITFEKVSENDLVSSARNCHAILNASSDGMLLLDMQGTIMGVNQAVARFLGMEKVRLEGTCIFDILPETFKSGKETLLEDIINKSKEPSGEIHLNKRQISYKAFPLELDGEGSPAIVVFGRDITMEKRLKDGLMNALRANKENKDFLEQLINGIPDIIGIQDRDHRIIRYNQAGYRFLGLTPEEVTGKRCYELIGRDSECVPCASRESLTTKSPAFLERFFPEQGIWFDIRSYPVMDTEGEIKYIIEHLRDITDLKRSQTELIKSRQRYWDLFNSSAAGVLLGSHEGFIIEVNEYFCQMTGFSREELIGRHISQSLFTGESILKTPFRFNLLEHGKPVSAKRDLKTADGSIVPIEMFTCIMPDGTYQSIYYDLTERKLAEEEISRQNQELKTLNLEKDRLFSIIAHDLRSPFTAILGLTEMISDEFDSMGSDEVKDILKELHRSAGNLYKLLDNLLEWAMVRRNKKPYNPTRILLFDLVKYSIQPLHENARAKKIDVYIDIAENLEVYADRNMLEIVIRNLFSNATKFTYKGGNIDLSAKQLPDDFISMSVSDTGMGIPADMLEKIFSVSHRNNRRGTKGEPSSGLGLLLCKEFVEKNQGVIFAESVEGKGSTFTFTIPAFKDAKRKNRNDKD